MENLIDLSGLGRRFAGPQGVVSVLDGIDLTIPRGTFTVIRGQSGAGKTTLLRILGLLDAGHDGTFRMAGTDVAKLSDADRDEWRMAGIGFVFQDGRLLPHLSLGENIALPSLYYTHTRDVIERRGLLVPVTHMTPPKDGEVAQQRQVRFRTVGDITCTCPVESNAATPEDIVIETLAADVSERGATRMDDQTSEASMEKRKKEGYF